MITKLTEFIRTEREHFSIRDNNLCGTAFSHLTRYYQFLLIILERYNEASEAFMKNMKASQELLKPGEHRATAEQFRLHEEEYVLTSMLHLEIESFYLFAKILLDRVARVLEFYFGPVPSRSLDSHDDLVRHLEKYAAQKGIGGVERLIETAMALKKNISDHRDYQIAHEKSPRTIFGTMSDAKGKTKMFICRFSTTGDNIPVATWEPDVLLQQLDDYLCLFLELITANRDRTRLKLLVEPGNTP